MNKILVFTMILVTSCAAFGQVWEIPQGTATVDADLSDWAGSTWIDMDVDAFWSPTNILNAKMAVKWDAGNIYMAVTYYDYDLQLSQSCLLWDAQDDIEVYINANNDDAADYGAAGWATAQHYFIGAKGDNPTGLSGTPAVPAGSWYDLGSVNPLPDAVNWPNTVIDVATKVTGNSLVYEMRIPAFSNMTTGELQSLAIGDTVGVDVIAADKGTSNYGWKGLNADGSKAVDASQFQDWVLAPALPTVHYTFKETAPGTWEVLVDVTGEGTAGLSAYEIWVDGVDPATVSFVENNLGSGFASLVQGEVVGSFNAGNYQSSDTAIEGIGKVAINEAGVVLDAQALLGILTTEADLTEENFRAVVAGLLNETGDGFYDADGLVPTFEVIQFVSGWIDGDANHDGVVSAGDYASVQANFGNVGDGILGDANGDGVVSAGDYASVQANFGNTAASSVVPEPASIAMLGLGLLGVLKRKKS